MPHGGRGRRSGLSADTLARIELDAWADRLAIAISRGEVDYPAAVAQLALVVPARPDLVDHVHGARIKPDSRDWPPVDIMRELLTQTRRVTTGELPLTGQDGTRVVHTATAREDGGRRYGLQVRDAAGALVAEVASAAQLTRYLDPSQLIAALGPGSGRDGDGDGTAPG